MCVCWVHGSRSHVVRCITLHVGLAGVRFVFAVFYGIQCHVRKVQSFSVVSCYLTACLKTLSLTDNDADIQMLNRGLTASYQQPRTQIKCAWGFVYFLCISKQHVFLEKQLTNQTAAAPGIASVLCLFYSKKKKNPYLQEIKKSGPQHLNMNKSLLVPLDQFVTRKRFFPSQIAAHVS